jgi:hypothetical protein
MRSIIPDLPRRFPVKAENDSMASIRHHESLQCQGGKGRQFAGTPESPTWVQDPHTLGKLNRRIYHGLHHAGIDYLKYQNTASFTLTIDHGLTSLADALLRRTSRNRMLKNRACEKSSPLIDAILVNNIVAACDMIERECATDTLDLSQPSPLLCASAVGARKIVHCLLNSKTRLHARRQQKITALVEQAKRPPRLDVHDLHDVHDMDVLQSTEGMAHMLSRHLRSEKLDEADRDELATAIHVAGKCRQLMLQKGLAKHYREALKAAMCNTCWETDVVAFVAAARQTGRGYRDRQAARDRKPVHCFVVQVDERLLYAHEDLAPLSMFNELQRFLSGIQREWKRIPDGQRFQLALQFESGIHWIACDFFKRAEGLDVFMLDPANSEHPLALLNMLLDHAGEQGMDTPRILTRYVFRQPDVTILSQPDTAIEEDSSFTAVLAMAHLDWQADHPLPGIADESGTRRCGQQSSQESSHLDRLHVETSYPGLRAALVKETRQFIDRLDDTELVDVYLERGNPMRMFHCATPLRDNRPAGCIVS